MYIHEGSRVAYVGDGEHDLQPGDSGKVLSSGEGAVHVLWSTGSQSGHVTLHSVYDVVVDGQVAEPVVDHHMLATSVRSTYDRDGVSATIDMMGDDGFLSVFAAVTDEAIDMVIGALRDDHQVQKALAFLESHEADEVVQATAATLFREAMGYGESM